MIAFLLTVTVAAHVCQGNLQHL